MVKEGRIMKEIKDTDKKLSNKESYGSVCFDDVIISDFGASKKGKKRTEYECNKIENVCAKVNKNLSVVEDYSDFSLKVKKVGIAKSKSVDVAKNVGKTQGEMETKALSATEVLAVNASTSAKNKTQKSANSSKNCAKCASKTAKTEKLNKNPLNLEDEVVTKVNTAPTATIKIKEDDFRQTIQTAAACNRVVFDEAAEQVVNIARMGSLFDCVKNY